MEFPIEEARHIFSIAQSTIDIINRLRDRLNPSGNSDNGGNGDEEDNVKKAILILTRETQAKKHSHLEKFVENTIENSECELEDSTIFSLLKDIEQMTWRQLCLLEGFRRRNKGQIDRIRESGGSGGSRSDINKEYMRIEIENLGNLRYLQIYDNQNQRYRGTGFSNIEISMTGEKLSSLLDLESIEIDEIAKAFGEGSIQYTVTR